MENFKIVTTRLVYFTLELVSQMSKRPFNFKFFPFNTKKADDNILFQQGFPTKTDEARASLVNTILKKWKYSGLFSMFSGMPIQLPTM